MKNCIVVGRVIPERAFVQFGRTEFNFDYPNCKGSGVAYAEFSQVTVHLKFDTDQPNRYDIVSIARSASASISNYIAFSLTAAYQLVFDMIIDTDNQMHHAVTVSEPFFGEENEPKYTFTKRKEHKEILIPNAVYDPTVQRCLDELANALRHPQLSPMYCRLAVETMRASFDIENESNGWRLLRETLSVGRETIDSFRELATEQRHGKIVRLDWEKRRSCLRIAWELVHRFVLLKENPSLQFEVI